MKLGSSVRAAGSYSHFHGLWAFGLHGPHFFIKKVLEILFDDCVGIKMVHLSSSDFKRLCNILMALPTHRGPGRTERLTPHVVTLAQRAFWRSSPCSSFRPHSHLPELQELSPHPLRCPDCALRQNRSYKGSFSSRVSAVEPVRAAGRINCLGTYVCADAGTRDCLSFFLEPELKFARVINGLASAIKASSITHSAKEAPEASVSHLLFFSRWVRAPQTRWRNV